LLLLRLLLGLVPGFKGSVDSDGVGLAICGMLGLGSASASWVDHSVAGSSSGSSSSCGVENEGAVSANTVGSSTRSNTVVEQWF
jgi:hypothetical protein